MENPVYDIPIVPAGFGCELDDYVALGQKVTLCGFGENENGQLDNKKRYGESEITLIDSDHTIKVGPASGDVVACPGDSGGPLLVQIADGSWRTIGITSKYNGTCGAGGYNRFAPIKGAVEWVEQEFGIDITPCFDADGTWNPTYECTGFWAGLGDNEPYGVWEDGCPETGDPGPVVGSFQ